MKALVQSWLVTHRRRRFRVSICRGPGLEHEAAVESREGRRRFAVRGKFSSGLVRQAVRHFLDVERMDGTNPSMEPAAAGGVTAALVGRPSVDGPRPLAAAAVDVRRESRAAGGLAHSRRPRDVFKDRKSAASGD